MDRFALLAECALAALFCPDELARIEAYNAPDLDLDELNQADIALARRLTYPERRAHG